MNAAATILRTNYDKLFIDGGWVLPAGAPDDVISPATEDVVGSAPCGGVADTEQALAAARRAFDRGPWPREKRAVRAAYMQRLVDLVTARREQAIGLMQLEMGFTRMQCEMQLDLCFTQLGRFVELAAKGAKAA